MGGSRLTNSSVDSCMDKKLPNWTSVSWHWKKQNSFYTSVSQHWKHNTIQRVLVLKNTTQSFMHQCVLTLKIQHNTFIHQHVLTLTILYTPACSDTNNTILYTPTCSDSDYSLYNKILYTPACPDTENTIFYAPACPDTENTILYTQPVLTLKAQHNTLYTCVFWHWKYNTIKLYNSVSSHWKYDTLLHDIHQHVQIPKMQHNTVHWWPKIIMMTATPSTTQGHQCLTWLHYIDIIT